jgi:hypothetical protein
VTEQDQLALEYLSGEFATYETRLYEEMGTTFRWVMATLFAANGGAIVALLHDGPRFLADTRALDFLAVGVIFSLLTGALSALMCLITIVPLTSMRAKVREALITKDIAKVEHALPQLVEKQKMKWWKWSPSGAGFVSFVSFVAGVIAIASR